MFEKILKAWIKTEPNGGGIKNSVAPDNLFKINENTKKTQYKKLSYIPQYCD